MAATAWDRRPAGALRREQGRRLAVWLQEEVRPFSDWWADRLGDAPVRSVDDLVRLPVVEEADIAGAGGPGNPALLLRPTEDQFKRSAGRGELVRAARELRGGGIEARRAALFRRYKPVHVHEAGVGALLAIASTRTDLDRLHLAGARLVEVLGLGASDALINAVPAGPTLAFWALYHAALAARMTALHPVTSGRRAGAAVARAFVLLPASVLAVRTADAEELLADLAERRVVAPRLRTLVVVGPPPSADARASLAEAAARLLPRNTGRVRPGGIRVQAVWGPDVGRSLWAECRPAPGDPQAATYGLHTTPDLEVLEVRDVATATSAAPGAEGELVLTTLGWRGTVLVRTATGVWTGGVVTGVPCPACGRTVPRLSPELVAAAWQPVAVAADGRRRRVDLRPAARVLTPAALARAGARDWSLRSVDGQLVLGLDLPGRDTAPALELAREVAAAVSAPCDVHLGAVAAAARPQLGEAGPGGAPGA